MAKTKSFRDLVERHVKGDKKFAEALLREGIDAMLSGDLDTGKTIMRDYIKATVGFEKLGEATDTPPKTLSACSARAATRRPKICSLSAICKRGRACSFTLPRSEFGKRRRHKVQSPEANMADSSGESA